MCLEKWRRSGFGLLLVFAFAATAANAKTLTVCDVLVNLPQLARPHTRTKLSAGVRGIWVVENRDNKRDFLVAERPCDPRPAPGLYRRPESIELSGKRRITDYMPGFAGPENDPVTGDPPFGVIHNRRGVKNIVVVHGELSFWDQSPGRGCGSGDQPLRTVYLSRETLRVVSTTPYTKDDLKRIQSESAAATDMSCEPVRPGAVKKDK